MKKIPKKEQMNALLKYASLSTIVIQTTTLVLVLRYSRTQTLTGPRYLSSTAIVISEFLKILVCLVFLFIQNDYRFLKLFSELYAEVWCKPRETFKLLIPAALYTIQNNLLFLALTFLDAATYQVTYQLKILTTALFSVALLNKRLTIQQWVSLMLLMAGVALVQLPSTGDKQVKQAAGTEVSTVNQVIGLLAVLAACCSSGFSGVYFEKLVKGTSQSLWIRNIQLAIFGTILSAGASILTDFAHIRAGGVFQGYNSITWIVIFLQTFGGVVVAIAIKYADNILKGFATSISIVISTFCSYFLLGDFHPTNYFFMGASIVITATLVYGYPLAISSGITNKT